MIGTPQISSMLRLPHELFCLVFHPGSHDNAGQPRLMDGKGKDYTSHSAHKHQLSGCTEQRGKDEVDQHRRDDGRPRVSERQVPIKRKFVHELELNVRPGNGQQCSSDKHITYLLSHQFSHECEIHSTLRRIRTDSTHICLHHPQLLFRSNCTFLRHCGCLLQR